MRVKGSRSGISKLAPFKLKGWTIPEGFSMVIDTREQKPLFTRIPPGLVICSKKLEHGDYSIGGHEDGGFFAERKGISDFMSYVGKERERTVKKLNAIQHFKYKCLVIEADERDLLRPQDFSMMAPEAIRQALCSFNIRFGLQIYYSSKREDVARWLLDRMLYYWKWVHIV